MLKYGEHSLSHLIVDGIFYAAPRPFETYTSCEFEAMQNKLGKLYIINTSA